MRHAHTKRRNGTETFFTPSLENLVKDFIDTGFQHVAYPKQTRPSANIQETPESFLIHLAVPGLTKKDLKMTIEKGRLKISAHAEKTEDAYKLQEFHFGTFERIFRLPKSADVEQIKATLKSGVLTVELAKKEEAKDKGPIDVEIK